MSVPWSMCIRTGINTGRRPSQPRNATGGGKSRAGSCQRDRGAAVGRWGVPGNTCKKEKDP